MPGVAGFRLEPVSEFGKLVRFDCDGVCAGRIGACRDVANEFRERTDPLDLQAVILGGEIALGLRVPGIVPAIEAENVFGK
jgi:hypothetical protein